jgi:hypothetical protein
MDGPHPSKDHTSPATPLPDESFDTLQQIASQRTQPLGYPQRHSWGRRGYIALLLLFATGLILAAKADNAFIPAFQQLPTATALVPTPTPEPPTPTPTPVFDPNKGAVLPTHRIVAFYAVPNAEPTGPAYVLSQEMLTRLKEQGDAYEQLDSEHPVQLGIDLVVSVPDSFPGPEGHYSHHVDAETIQAYIDFCQKHDLLLFLDLNFGQAPIMKEFTFFLPYLQKYSFVHLAIDPEWMFPRRDGIPGINLSNVRASDLNPMLRAVAEIPMQSHVPRKIVLIHQYRPNGDELKNPFDAAQAEIADKRHLISDPRVDVVIHVDSVGGYPGDIEDKVRQYSEWVQQDMEKYGNFLYGGFKLFYKIESKTRLMTPREVLKLEPPPMIITYGN